MNAHLLQLLISCLLLLCVQASNGRSIKLTYKQGKAKQPNEFYAKQLPTMNKQWSGSSKLVSSGLLKDTFLFNYSIGEPSIDYSLTVETGIRGLWLIDISYKVVSSNVQEYDSSKSTTSQKLGELVGGYTEIIALNGISYVDNIGFPGDSKWTQEFAAINDSMNINAQQELFTTDGIIGLGWNLTEDVTQLTKDSSPVLHFLKAQLAEKKVFSFWIENNSTEEASTALLSLGHLDSQNCKTGIVWTPLYDLGSYAPLAFKVSGFKMGKYVSKREYMGKVDTGFSTIFMPLVPAMAIYKAINPEFDEGLNILTTPCSNKGKFDDWVFTIGGQDITLSSDQYIVDAGLGNGHCVLTLNNIDGAPVDWVFGTPILRQFCQHFDIEGQKLGLSEAL